MSSNYQDRFPDMLEDFLGEELYQEAKARGIKDNRMMVWYHGLGRNQELFKERVKQALEETEELTKSFNDSIENLKNQIEALEEMKIGVLEDSVFEE